jgi:nitroimidazol reductase NimA-like FMN-containing flavoprotein (pyridoxamine 5'-phosphate oxidase superfamily)
MLGVTGSYTSQEADPATSIQDIYIHGYVSSRLMKQSSPRDEEGTPVTVAATLMDGLVVSLTPNHHSCNYRSAVVFGYAALVTDEAEKMWAMEHITNNMIPDLWAHGRIPPTKAEMSSTSILRVRISSASAKVRSGEPGDDRHDLKDEELRKRVWTGVVPSWTQWGEPIPASTNRVKDTPEFMESWRAVTNKDARVGAYEAAEEKET